MYLPDLLTNLIKLKTLSVLCILVHFLSFDLTINCNNYCPALLIPLCRFIIIIISISNYLVCCNFYYTCIFMTVTFSNFYFSKEIYVEKMTKYKPFYLRFISTFICFSLLLLTFYSYVLPLTACTLHCILYLYILRNLIFSAAVT